MAKNKGGGGNQNQKPAGNGILGSVALSPDQIGKDGKDFPTTMGHAILTCVGIVSAAGAMFGAKKLFCTLFGLPFNGPAKAAPKQVEGQRNDAPADPDLEASIRKYVGFNLDDDTTMGDIGSIRAKIVEMNSELVGHESLVGKITAEEVKAHVKSLGEK